jgi:hypothetical protein
MLKVGDKIKVVGLGEMFVSLVEGATGTGIVVHIGRDGVIETSDFPEHDQYKEFFPEQYNDGIFYTDEGTGQALWIAPEDYEIIEPTPEA